MKCENNQQSQDIYKYKPIFQFCLRAKCKSHSKPTQTFVLQISAALNYHYEDRIHQDAMFVCQNAYKYTQEPIRFYKQTCAPSHSSLPASNTDG